MRGPAPARGIGFIRQRPPLRRFFWLSPCGRLNDGRIARHTRDTVGYRARSSQTRIALAKHLPRYSRTIHDPLPKKRPSAGRESSHKGSALRLPDG